MDIVNQFLESVMHFLAILKVNPMYVLLWVCAGYIQATYFKAVTTVGDTWKTLILGSIFSLVYVVLWRNATEKATWHEFLASYLFATSLYEVILKYIVAAILRYVRGYVKGKFKVDKPTV